MTERKPPNVSFQTWIEKQILDAADRGAFDGLEGHGQPIADVDRPRDELWWVRQKLRREGVDYLPPAIAIRKTHDDAVRQAAIAGTEAEVRSILEPVNSEIVYLNSHTVSGPPTTVAPIDIDEFVDRWRASRTEPEPRGSDALSDTTAAPIDPRRHRRFLRRRRA